MTKFSPLLNSLILDFFYLHLLLVKNVKAADYKNVLQKFAMTISIPRQKDKWVVVKYENKWYPGFIKEVTENIFFAALVTVTVINIYTYNKYLELLLEFEFLNFPKKDRGVQFFP